MKRLLKALGLTFSSDSTKRRPDRVSSKNKNRTGGQSSGVGKNAAHLSPSKKVAGKKKETHTVKAKGQRGGMKRK